ncbi:MAG: hypothetical protein WCP35_01190 [Verrucomicrobiota bacterium]
MKSYPQLLLFGFLACGFAYKAYNKPWISNPMPKTKFHSFLKTMLRASGKAVRAIWLAAGIGTGITAIATAQTAPVTVIGPEAKIALPTSAEWSFVINFRPGHQETVNINPPRFSWCYTPTARNTYSDQSVKQFQFQVANEPTFANPVINLTTDVNFYNTLAPFSGSKVWYWRVRYITPFGTLSTNDGTQRQIELLDGWSDVRKFTIADNATAWNRSMLADEAYLASKASHPHVLFNASNREAMHAYLEAQAVKWLALPTLLGEPWEREIGKGWVYAKASADRDIASDWWNDILTNTNWVSHHISCDNATYQRLAIGTAVPPELTKSISNDELGLYTANVAFVWQMTKDPKYLAAQPGVVVGKLAQYYVTNSDLGGAWQSDAVSGGYGREMILGFGQSYDWLYEIMTPAQRASVLYAIERNCNWLLHCGAWGEGWQKPTVWAPWLADPMNYTGDYRVQSPSPFKLGTSHWIDNQQSAMAAALASYGDTGAVWSRKLFDIGVNYMIGVTYPMGCDGGLNQGRMYSAFCFESPDTLRAAMLYHYTFPEAQLNKNPFFKLNSAWWSAMVPVGFEQGHEPWGDTGWGRFDELHQIGFGRDLACFLGDGVMWKHWREEDMLYDRDRGTQKPVEMATVFLCPPPAEEISTHLVQLYPQEGWVIGSTYATNTAAGFKDGVGFVFQARPRGSETGHSHFSDLSYQIWAYGVTVTDGGSGMSGYAKIPISHYSLLVDGLGQCQSGNAPMEPFYSRIIAFKDTPNYTYCAADGTAAYPHETFQADGWLLPHEYGALHSNGDLAYVKKVQRHMLFVRKKYFVVYDDLESEKDSKFTWLYHILGPYTFKPESANQLAVGYHIWPYHLDHFSTMQTLDPSGTSFYYDSSNLYPDTVMRAKYKTVRTYVAHITNPNNLEIINLTGDRVCSNPLTIGNAKLTPSVLPTGATVVEENYYDRSDSVERTNALWVSNKVKAKKFHFMTVIYPVKPDSPVPVITRLDDFTAKVVSDGESDIISFDPHTKFPATLVIDLSTKPPAPGVPAVSVPRLSTTP